MLDIKNSQEMELTQINPPKLISKVMLWELKRLFKSHTMWLVIVVTFCFFLFPVWAGRQAAVLFNEDTGISVSVDGSSAWGMIIIIPRTILLVLGMFLPFLTTDLVARDAKRHTHELIMTSSIPGWAYVGGRYLAGLILGLSLATLVLISILSMCFVLQLTNDAPVVNYGSIIAIWAATILPATITISSISFTLGTLLPRISNLVKLLILGIWIVLAIVMIPSLEKSSNWPWYTFWNPSANGLTKVLDGKYQLSYYALSLQIRNNTEAVRVVHYLEQQLPDLGPWIWPQITLTILAMLLTLIPVFRFRRFRE